jgi:raffinose/stachyose/melibiose transport system substrate-binding protein
MGISTSTALKAPMEANEGPDVAMFHPGDRVDGFADAIVDLDPYIGDAKGQFTAASIEICSLNQSLGKSVKVLPLTMQGFGIYYNKARFAQVGLDPAKEPRPQATLPLFRGPRRSH